MIYLHPTMTIGEALSLARRIGREAVYTANGRVILR